MTNQGLGSPFALIIGRVLGRTGRLARGPSPAPSPSPAQVRGAAYPGDFRGTPEISYEPNPGNGNEADPGEIVWTWVPFEEDHSHGKDRPVLVIGRASEVRVDRILRVDPAGVRREGAVLNEGRFNRVASAVRDTD